MRAIFDICPSFELFHPPINLYLASEVIV